MTSPTPGSTLPGSTVTFQWTGGSSPYTLRIGSPPGGSDIYSSGTNAQSLTVSNLPTDGRTLYVRLFSVVNGKFVFNDYTYTAAH
jgi:hypothetical protein